MDLHLRLVHLLGNVSYCSKDQEKQRPSRRTALVVSLRRASDDYCDDAHCPVR